MKEMVCAGGDRRGNPNLPPQLFGRLTVCTHTWILHCLDNGSKLNTRPCNILHKLTIGVSYIMSKIFCDWSCMVACGYLNWRRNNVSWMLGYNLIWSTVDSGRRGINNTSSWHCDVMKIWYINMPTKLNLIIYFTVRASSDKCYLYQWSPSHMSKWG